MLFILFAACVGHIGAMEPDKGIEQKKQGMQQGTKVPFLTQLATIAAAKKLVQEIHSESPQDIKTYITDKTKLPRDLHVPLLAEIGRQYYMLYGIQLKTGVPWGLSIQDYLDSPALRKKIQITTPRTLTHLDLRNMKINNLKGLQNILNIGTVQMLLLDRNQLNTIPTNAFAGLTSLIYLSLEDNQLRTIPTDAFAGLTKLKVLYLSYNQLSKKTKEEIRKALPGVTISF